VLVLAVLVGLGAVLARALGTRSEARRDLDARYARGEIGRDEYLRKRNDLSG
jgi:uncharacterized membrane protein